VTGVYIQCEPVQRSEHRCDIIEFRNFNHSTCKTVLNLLKEIIICDFGRLRLYYRELQ